MFAVVLAAGFCCLDESEAAVRSWAIRAGMHRTFATVPGSNAFGSAKELLVG